MKKYIDLLTIGNLSSELLTILSPLRQIYNVVSCRTESSARLIKPLSKLVLTQKDNKTFINNEQVDLSYFEYYLENAAYKLDKTKFDYFYAVAANRKNVDRLPKLLEEIIEYRSNDTTCIVTVPVDEFASLEDMPENIQTLLEINCDKIVFLQSVLPYDYCRTITAVKFMKENGLENKTLISLDLDTDYKKEALIKFYRLIEETENSTITAAATPDTLFDTPVVSNRLTAVKPVFFADLLWQGLRPAVIANSPANYWLTFNLWSADVSQTTYYTKFLNIVPDNSEVSVKTKSFYNELARLGINKLLIDEVENDI